MEVSYVGDEEVRFNILNGEVSVDVFNNDGKTVSYSYALADYATAADVMKAMMEIPSLTVNLVCFRCRSFKDSLAGLSCRPE